MVSPSHLIKMFRQLGAPLTVRPHDVGKTAYAELR